MKFRIISLVPEEYRLGLSLNLSSSQTKISPEIKEKSKTEKKENKNDK